MNNPCYLAILSANSDGTYTEAVGCGRMNLGGSSNAVLALVGAGIVFDYPVTQLINATHYALFNAPEGGTPIGVYPLEKPRLIPVGGVPILKQGVLLIGVDMIGEELGQSIGNLCM